MTAPIDEGRPGYTSRASNIFTMTNLATALRVFQFEPVGDDNEVDYAIYFPGVTTIVNQTSFGADHAPGGSEPARNLHMVQAISYNDQPVNKVLFDILFHQAHVGMLAKRVLPNGDAGLNEWTPSTGSSPHYQYVDESFESPSTGNFIHTINPDKTEKFDLENPPSNTTRCHEALIMAWVAITRGTDTGLAFQFKLTNGSDVVLQPTCDVLADVVIDGTTTARPITAKMEAIDNPNLISARLHVISKRGAAGGGPNPDWYLYAIEVMAYFEINDVEIINTASVTALDSFCSPTLLRFSEWQGTYENCLLDAMGHKPALFFYVDWLGRLSLGKIAKYSDVSTPLDLSANVREVIRGPYKYRERTANVVELKWGVVVRATTTGTAEEDPVNDPANRGSRRIRRGATKVAERGIEDAMTLDRHYIAGTANAVVANACAEEYLNLWSKDIDAFEIKFDMFAIQVEPGDVITLTLPSIGLNARKLCVVANPYNADEDSVTLTLYDLEYTL